MKIRKTIPGVDPRLLVKDAGKLLPDPMRRNFLRGAASLGTLTLLTGTASLHAIAGTSPAMTNAVSVRSPELQVFPAR
jgi:hypothetical protein